MEARGRRSHVIAFAASAAVFVVASVAAELTLRLARSNPAACVPRFALTYFNLAVLCLVLARFVFRIDVRRLGLRRCPLRALRTPASCAFLVGGIGGALALAIGFEMPGCVRGLSLLELVVLTWVMASLAEELLARGLLQGLLSAPTGTPVAAAGIHWSAVASAVFFAALHLPLLALSPDRGGVALVVAFAFGLGLIAGHARHVTGSLWPAVAAHSAANAAGTLVGVAAQLLQLSP
jgi:membrane protease YdiL (CAAX protease family)